MAERLWRFYGCRLMCSTPKEAETSRINYGIPKEYTSELKAQDLAPMIFLARSERMEEALLHELLHLELVRIGYPRFYFDRTERVGLCGGIANSADHVVMLPRFTTLGYDANRFLTPRPLDANDEAILKEIEALPNLHTPAGYTASVPTHLKKHGFGFRLTFVRN